MNRKCHRITISVLTVALLAPVGAFAAGGSSSEPTAAEPSDPKAMAEDGYNRAIKYREKADELEAKAAAAETDEERRKLEQKATKEYERAIRVLRTAVDNDPTLHRAWSDLGYALRKVGEYEESLDAYNQALELEPSYVPAIEYRGEAFLGLDRLEEAKEAYMQLFRMDRGQADELMAAMRGWIDEHQAAPEGVDPATFEEFSSWVSERLDLASQVGAAASGASW